MIVNEYNKQYNQLKFLLISNNKLYLTSNRIFIPRVWSTFQCIAAILYLNKQVLTKEIEGNSISLC